MGKKPYESENITYKSETVLIALFSHQELSKRRRKGIKQ